MEPSWVRRERYRRQWGCGGGKDDDALRYGLALAQQVAREHRGTLAYRSRPGHTVFTLMLPQSLHDTDEERHVH